MKTKLLGLAVGLLAVANTSAADADQYNLTIFPGWALGVNDLGQVAGTIGNGPDTAPYIWNGGPKVTLLGSPSGLGAATDINNAGVVAGYLSGPPPSHESIIAPPQMRLLRQPNSGMVVEEGYDYVADWVLDDQPV